MRPSIGHVRLARLSTVHCQALVSELERRYGRGTGRALEALAELVGTAGLADRLQLEAEAGLGDLNAADLLGHFGSAGGTTRDAARRAATHTKQQLRHQVTRHFRAAWLAVHAAGPDLFTAAQAAAETALERQLDASTTHLDGAAAEQWDAALGIAARLRDMGAIPGFLAAHRAIAGAQHCHAAGRSSVFRYSNATVTNASSAVVAPSTSTTSAPPTTTPPATSAPSAALATSSERPRREAEQRQLSASHGSARPRNTPA